MSYLIEYESISTDGFHILWTIKAELPFIESQEFWSIFLLNVLLYFTITDGKKTPVGWEGTGDTIKFSYACKQILILLRTRPNMTHSKYVIQHPQPERAGKQYNVIQCNNGIGSSASWTADSLTSGECSGRTSLLCLLGLASRTWKLGTNSLNCLCSYISGEQVAWASCYLIVMINLCRLSNRRSIWYNIVM